MKRFSDLLTFFSLMTLFFITLAVAWSDWPRRSAESFVDKHYRAQIQVDNPFQEGTTEFTNFEQRTKPALLVRERERISKLKLVPHQRSVSDLLAGRQSFDFGMLEFTICRGKIVSGPTPFFDSAMRYYR